MTKLEDVYIAAGVTALLVTLSAIGLLRQRPETDASTNVSSKHVKELQPVEFCGVTYYTRPTVLFGIDMMTRVAEVAAERPETFVCKNIQERPNRSIPLSVELTNFLSATGETRFYLRIESLLFSFDPTTKEIFLHSSFDGTPSLFGLFD